MAGLAWWRRSWLLDQEWGEYWPGLAALLPPTIPLARAWIESADVPPALRQYTIPSILLAIASVQAYGQLRAKRNRIAADARLNEQGTRISGIATEIGEQRVEINEQGLALGSIADAIRSQGTRINGQGLALRSIANAIREQQIELSEVKSSVIATKAAVDEQTSSVGAMAEKIGTSSPDNSRRGENKFKQSNRQAPRRRTSRNYKNNL